MPSSSGSPPDPIPGAGAPAPVPAAAPSTGARASNPPGSQASTSAPAPHPPVPPMPTPSAPPASLLGLDAEDPGDHAPPLAVAVKCLTEDTSELPTATAIPAPTGVEGTAAGRGVPGGADRARDILLRVEQRRQAGADMGGDAFCYERGAVARYRNAAGVQKCTILEVHWDDLLMPYYTIRLEDGREKQTDNAHLSAWAPYDRFDGRAAVEPSVTPLHDDVDEDALGDEFDTGRGTIDSVPNYLRV